MSVIERSFLLYGPPGSGKTTVSEAISKKDGLTYVSVGELTRKEITSGTDIGNQLQEYLNRVEQYPVRLISSLIEARLNAIRNLGPKFILDGFPKYPNEAERFKNFLSESGLDLNTAVILEFTLQEGLARIRNRRICTKCNSQITLAGSEIACPNCSGKLSIREDDQPEVYKRRFDDHLNAVDSTLGILKEELPNIITVNAAQSKLDVVRSIRTQLASIYKPE